MTRYLRKTSTTADRGQNQRSKASNLEKIETVEREKQLKLLVSSEKSEEKDYPCENFFKDAITIYKENSECKKSS